MSDVRAGPGLAILAGIDAIGVFFLFLSGTISHNLGGVGFITVVVLGGLVRVGAGGRLDFRFGCCCSCCGAACHCSCCSAS